MHHARGLARYSFKQRRKRWEKWSTVTSTRFQGALLSRLLLRCALLLLVHDSCKASSCTVCLVSALNREMQAARAFCRRLYNIQPCRVVSRYCYTGIPCQSKVSANVVGASSISIPNDEIDVCLDTGFISQLVTAVVEVCKQLSKTAQAY